jgi:hypothetical protein
MKTPLIYFAFAEVVVPPQPRVLLLLKVYRKEEDAKARSCFFFHICCGHERRKDTKISFRACSHKQGLRSAREAMRLLVYEHVSGGGFVGEGLSPDILSEGYGMLRSLVSDLKTAGHETTVLLDSRLSMLNPPLEADKTISISSLTGLDKTLRNLVGTVDAAYTIAPEFNQTLRRLVELVETYGGTSLNAQINAIRKASNKMSTYEALRRKKLRIPETTTASLKENLENIVRQARKLRFPLVFKPLDGVGCCGLSVVTAERHVAAAVKKIREESINELFIMQKLIEGVDVSVSLISTGERALPITLNKQLVTLASPYEQSGYTGGLVPFSHKLEKKALETARIAVESIKGLKGYVGVDMTLTDKEPFIMEINPRLTTSYLGLRKVINFNPAQAIIDAALERRLPKNQATEGYVLFSKVKVSPPKHQVLKETYELKEVVSPPFPMASDKPAYALVATYSDSPEKAEAAFHKAREHLLKLCERRN